MATDMSKMIRELVDASKQATEKFSTAAEQQGDNIAALIQMEMAGQSFTVNERQVLLAGVADTSTKTAEAISKKLGQEEAITRELEHQLTSMFSRDKEAQVTYEKATKEDKDVMLAQMKQEAMANLNLTEDFILDNQNFISNALANVDETMGEIVEKSANIFHPLIGNITRAMDDFRHSIVESAPILGRFMSDAMMEHYKTGLGEIGDQFKSGFQTIMAPMAAITGPLMAVGKSMFLIGKTLFSGPTKHEQQTAKTQREIRDGIRILNQEKNAQWVQEKDLAIKSWFAQKKANFIAKKIWLQGKVKAAKEAVGKGVQKGKDAMSAVWDGLKMIGPALVALAASTWATISPLLTLAGTAFLTAIPFILIGVAVVALGVAIWMFWAEIKTVAMKIGEVATFLWENFTGMWDRIFKFFDDMFSGEFDIVDTAINFIKDMFNGIKKALIHAIPGGSLFFDVEDEEPTAKKRQPDNYQDVKVGDTMKIGGATYTKLPPEELSNVDTNKNVDKPPSTTIANTAKAEKVKEQIAIQKETQKSLDRTNGSIAENTEQQKNIITNIQQNNTEKPVDIPTENSDLGIMFSNATHGA